jgi:hypothetical protein
VCEDMKWTEGLMVFCGSVVEESGSITVDLMG